MINDVSKVAERMLVKKLEALPIDKLSGNLPAFEQFASFAYAPSLSLQKLTDLANNSYQLSSTIADLIENSRLRERGCAAKNKLWHRLGHVQSTITYQEVKCLRKSTNHFGLLTFKYLEKRYHPLE